MKDTTKQLHYVYDGWEGYNRSLISAVVPLGPEQFQFRGSPEMRSVGELVWHIADGRVDWYGRIAPAPCDELSASVSSRQGHPPAHYTGEDVAAWLQTTYFMVDQTLRQWTTDDLAETYPQPYLGKVYAVTRQWVIWRILCHDLHHGGQLSELLALQGIFPNELTQLGGHLTEPEVIRDV